MKTIKKYLPLLLACLIIACGEENNKKTGLSTYEKRLASFKTKLIKHEKAPQGGAKLVDKGTIKAVSYQSNGLELQALLETKNIDPTKRKPALVFLHGGFGLGMSDVTDCQLFTDNDFIVFSPSYRGENQNGGNFELLMGEVADAKEAIRWIAKQPYVDTTKIYTFGHSIDGAMSINLSLHSDIPVCIGGSSAGLYPLLPKNFNPPVLNTSEDDLDKTSGVNPETELRLAIYNLESLRRPHYMYVGKADNYDMYKEILNIKYPLIPGNFKIIPLEGNHFSSLQPAFEAYFEVVKEDMKNKLLLINN